MAILTGFIEMSVSKGLNCENDRNITAVNNKYKRYDWASKKPALKERKDVDIEISKKN